MDSGNIAWVLISTALVLFMTPGLAFFYGGMVRSKNFLAMLMQNYFAMGLLAVLWVLFGASIAFGNLGDGGWFGGFDFAGFQDITINSKQFAAFTGGIPDPLFLAFQTWEPTSGLSAMRPPVIGGAAVRSWPPVWRIGGRARVRARRRRWWWGAAQAAYPTRGKACSSAWRTGANRSRSESTSSARMINSLHTKAT